MKIFSYPRNIELWRRKTSKLSLEQRGIYSELVDWYYFTGGDMPSDLDALCRMIGAIKRTERENVRSVMSNPDLFSIEDGRLVQKMCDETLTFIAEKSSKAALSAKSRYSNNKDLGDANAERTQSEGSANYKLETIINNPQEGLFTEPQPAKPKETANAKPKRPKSENVPLPADWKPHERHLEKCRSLSLDVESLAEQFRNHHLARATKFANWDAAFFTWIGNATRFGGSSAGRSSGGGREPAGIVAAGLRVAARYEKKMASGV